MAHLHDILDAAENDNFAGCIALWRRFRRACPDEAERLTPAGQEEIPILTEGQKRAMIQWGQREVAGMSAAARARQMNAQLPQADYDMLKLKGMIS